MKENTHLQFLFCGLDVSPVDISTNACQEYDYDWGYAKYIYCQSTSDGYPTVVERYAGILGKLECRYGDESHYRRTYATEDGSNNGIVLELMEEHGNEQYYEERWQCSSYARHYGSRQFFQPIADKCAHIYRQRSWTALRYSHNVKEILWLDPFSLVHHFLLNDWNHGIATAKSKQSNAEECLEEVFIHIS